MANLFILFPCDYFDIKKVDRDYEYEYQQAICFPEFKVAFYNYDQFVSEGILKFYPADLEEGICIYRGWMLQPEKYLRLYQELAGKGLYLINTPAEYENCHEFPNSYPYLSGFTKGMMSYDRDEAMDWSKIKASFPKFMMKDYVKSVKGSDFPVFFDASYSDEQLEEYKEKFIELRGSLFVKGIVIKEYVELKKYGSTTNEYRVFYMNGRILSVSPNSNQKECRPVPMELLQKMPQLPSHFYTVDFAELLNGDWIVIETGDGQVSGLSPKQFVFGFYESVLHMFS